MKTLKASDIMNLTEGLLYCAQHHKDFRCFDKCPYKRQDRNMFCQTDMKLNAAEKIAELMIIIQGLIAENEKLKKQLSEQQPEWISVEDEPPKEPGRILINRKNSTRVNTYSYKGNKKELKNFAYWMPMPIAPEPPKPKEPTFRDVFLKAFPKAEKVEDRPALCVHTVFPYVDECEMNGGMRCKKCWNQPYFDEEGEAE